MNENKQKMTDINWFILINVALVFDFIGWVLMLGINEIAYGIPGVLLNLVAVLIFLTFAIFWRDKGIANTKFFTSLGLNFLIEEIPFVGTILPMWTAMIYRARRTYKKGSPVALPQETRTKTPTKKLQPKRSLARV